MTRVACATIVLLGCAAAPAREAPAEPAVAPFETRLAASVTWQPGDAEPVERDVARWGVDDEDAPVQPMTWRVEIRNRCTVPATFVVGPATEAPPSDAPRNVLEAGGAIWAWIPGGNALHLQDPAGGPSMTATIGAAQVVFRGDETCDRIAQP
jgi:hypothetical protein